MKTVTLEDLTPETQRVVENWFCEKTPVTLERAKRAGGELEFLAPDDDISFEMTPEEEAELLEDIQRAEAEFAAGRFITLDQFKVKYAHRFQRSR